MTTPAPTPIPHNRTDVNYRDVPPRRVAVAGGIIDVHNHTREVPYTQTFVDAATAYGITEFWTMCGLEHAPALAEKWPGQFHFIAVPAWQNANSSEEFANDWIRRVDKFYELGARLIKFHLAPGTKKKWGITAEHPMIQRVAKHAYSIGYHMMSHVGDPKAWFYGKGRYAEGYGTFESQFEGVERLLEEFPDRVHLGAHMGGCLEDIDALAKRLDKYPNYILDTSATKWIVRAIAEPCSPSPNALRDFFLAYQDRILFGSDLVVGDKFSWDHYASRFWAHQKLWETDYRGESPIEDPDAGQGFDPRTGTWDARKADGIPKLVGLDLPAEVLVKLYRKNAERWLPRG
jgi:predicted TIM-barrel fold metal-dependent hydrolase